MRVTPEDRMRMTHEEWLKVLDKEEADKKAAKLAVKEAAEKAEEEEEKEQAIWDEIHRLRVSESIRAHAEFERDDKIRYLARASAREYEELYFRGRGQRVEPEHDRLQCFMPQPPGGSKW